MSSDTYRLKVVTPAGTFLSDEATSVTLPTTLGEIGILPQHTTYTGLLGIGIMQCSLKDGSTQRFVVDKGFCSFSEGTLVVLADGISTAEEANPTEFAKLRQSLEEKLLALNGYEREWQKVRDEMSRIDAVNSL